MAKTLLICTLAFVAGAIATAVPFYLIGHFAHLDEAARKQETMGPAITMLFGFAMSPLGGIVAVAIALWVRRQKKRNGTRLQV